MPTLIEITLPDFHSLRPLGDWAPFLREPVPGEWSFTARTINPIKKFVKITKLWGYIPLI
jgi:hypothetical protein